MILAFSVGLSFQRCLHQCFVTRIMRHESVISSSVPHLDGTHGHHTPLIWKSTRYLAVACELGEIANVSVPEVWKNEPQL